MSGHELRTNRRSSRPQFLRSSRVAACCCALLGLVGGVEVASAQSWLPVPKQPANPAPSYPAHPGGGLLGGLLPAAPREPAGQLVSRTAHPAVARIVVQEKNGVSYGTGSLVDVRGEHGLIVTNWHVVRDSGGGSIYAFFADGFQTPATIVKADRDWDLAALSIRKPPGVQPLTIARTAPQIGEWLCIAGYGSGDYRAVAGRCTQYVSPSTSLPYEMVELGAEARQGDSGGPIFNERLELAGVLFGAANGTTSGSYSGRVAGFLQGVVPNESPAAAPPTANLAQQQPVYPQQQPGYSQQQPAAPIHTAPLADAPAPAADAHLFAAAPPAQPLPTAPPLAIDTVVPVTDHARAALQNVAQQNASDSPPRQLMPLPERNAVPLTLVTGEEPLAEDRTALRPTRSLDHLEHRDLSITPRHEGPIAADALNLTHALPSRVHTGAPLEATPADQLIAAAWKQIGGSTLFDQGKTLLAVLGLLGLLIQFWRLNSRPDHLGDDD